MVKLLLFNYVVLLKATLQINTAYTTDCCENLQAPNLSHQKKLLIKVEGVTTHYSVTKGYTTN